MKLILGNITFLDRQIDGIHKAIVHEVHGVIDCGSEEQACRIGEDLVNEFESYIVPEVYTGIVEYECLASCSFDVSELNPNRPIVDKIGDQLDVEDSVEVDEPTGSDMHQHSFIGNITGFKNRNVIVEDMDGDSFEVESHKVQLTHDKY